jgi:hypothetical protein
MNTSDKASRMRSKTRVKSCGQQVDLNDDFEQ